MTDQLSIKTTTLPEMVVELKGAWEKVILLPEEKKHLARTINGYYVEVDGNGFSEQHRYRLEVVDKECLWHQPWLTGLQGKTLLVSPTTNFRHTLGEGSWQDCQAMVRLERPCVPGSLYVEKAAEEVDITHIGKNSVLLKTTQEPLGPTFLVYRPLLTMRLVDAVFEAGIWQKQSSLKVVFEEERSENYVL